MSEAASGASPPSWARANKNRTTARPGSEYQIEPNSAEMARRYGNDVIVDSIIVERIGPLIDKSVMEPPNDAGSRGCRSARLRPPTVASIRRHRPKEPLPDQVCSQGPRQGSKQYGLARGAVKCQHISDAASQCRR